MNAYEIMLMLDPELAEERQNEILARTRELIEKRGGSWVGHEPWGRRKLAYEIDRKGEASYHVFHFDADAPVHEAELAEDGAQGIGLGGVAAVQRRQGGERIEGHRRRRRRKTKTRDDTPAAILTGPKPTFGKSQ